LVLPGRRAVDLDVGKFLTVLLLFNVSPSPPWFLDSPPLTFLLWSFRPRFKRSPQTRNFSPPPLTPLPSRHQLPFFFPPSPGRRGWLPLLQGLLQFFRGQGHEDSCFLTFYSSFPALRLRRVLHFFLSMWPVSDNGSLWESACRYSGLPPLTVNCPYLVRFQYLTPLFPHRYPPFYLPFFLKYIFFTFPSIVQVSGFESQVGY